MKHHRRTTPLRVKRKPRLIRTTTAAYQLRLRRRLQKKAWKVFAEYIRLRDKGCFTCPQTEGMFHAGHFWHGQLDFNEQNINKQCVRCNFRLRGNLGVYARNLIGKYGLEGFDQLAATRNYQYSVSELQAVIDKYSKLIPSAKKS